MDPLMAFDGMPGTETFGWVLVTSAHHFHFCCASPVDGHPILNSSYRAESFL